VLPLVRAVVRLRWNDAERRSQRKREAAVVEADLRPGRRVAPQRRSARVQLSAAAFDLGSGLGRLHRQHVGAHRRLLRRHASDGRRARPDAVARPDRRPGDREQTDEDSLMDNKPHFSPLDYVSVIRRRRWWWITPIALSIVTGWLLVRFVPREYKSS